MKKLTEFVLPSSIAFIAPIILIALPLIGGYKIGQLNQSTEVWWLYEKTLGLAVSPIAASLRISLLSLVCIFLAVISWRIKTKNPTDSRLKKYDLWHKRGAIFCSGAMSLFAGIFTAYWLSQTFVPFITPLGMLLGYASFALFLSYCWYYLLRDAFSPF